ncbi:response regulator [Mucilaginibacter sp.]|uniref:response regulator n=1 Tax=Mucilaginibacter sp. TaxID=1882438 RepID=UPI002601708A|nr:response regulator [Mucilaginibacter sp.]
MANRRFSYFILAAFVLGAFLLIFVLYNSARNTNKLIAGNTELLRELRLSDYLREIDQDIYSAESRIRGAIATNDTSHLAGVDEKIEIVKIYLDSLDKDNSDPKVKKLIVRLEGLADEKIKNKDRLIGRFLAIGNMNDTSLVANPRSRRITDEIALAFSKIHDSRQKSMIRLSVAIRDDIYKARLYRDVLIALLLVGGAGICWFIVNQFRQQSLLIIKLNTSEKRAQEAALVKENFLTNMSHEIRTPLSAILGFTNLLKHHELDTRSQEFVDSIQSAGENLLTIVNDILDFSKIEAGMMRIVPAPFSVRGLLHSIETLFMGKIKDKGLAFHSSIDREVPDTLVGDATRLTQILVNLIGNALKFSEQGDIRVEIYKKQIEGNSIQLGLKVADNGIGIEKGKLKVIFERFNQAEDSITRAYGGTGLGLSIVKDLVLLQGGDISVKSEPGKGTEFSLYIPYLVADEQITEIPAIDTGYYKDKISMSACILVVDDNAMNQSLIKHLLEQWHAVFDIAGSGKEALSLMKTKTYDLVLMDIQMPDMDGYTTTRYIRTELKSDVPVIAMTAHAMAGEREKCISMGMNEYIPKPVNVHDLFRMITKFIAAKPAKETIAIQAQEMPAYQFIDLTYMKEVSNGSKAYERTITSQFIQYLPGDLAGLRDAFDNDDTPAINQTAHNMKTSVAIMGLLPRLGNILDALEHAAVADGGVLTLINNLETICMNALAEAEYFYKTL